MSSTNGYYVHNDHLPAKIEKLANCSSLVESTSASVSLLDKMTNAVV